jgi:hypothetical protein
MDDAEGAEPPSQIVEVREEHLGVASCRQGTDQPRSGAVDQRLGQMPLFLVAGRHDLGLLGADHLPLRMSLSRDRLENRITRDILDTAGPRKRRVRKKASPNAVGIPHDRVLAQGVANRRKLVPKPAHERHQMLPVRGANSCWCDKDGFRQQ